VTLENIARSQKYPCANRQSGCLELFSIEHIAEHHVVCVYGNIKCPLQIIGVCSWKGIKSDLKEHAKTAHLKYFHDSSKIHSPHLSESFVILSCFGELFVYHQQIHDGRFYGTFKLIGKSSEVYKYKCEFTLRAENGIEQISKTFLLRSSAGDLDISFNSGKFLSL
jgi:hypothetical protein